MQRSRLLALFGFLLASSLAASGSFAVPVMPHFNIAATDATISSSGSDGTGHTTFTLTSVDGYTRTVQLTCDPPTPPMGVTIPYCGGGPVIPPYTLTANQVVTGSIGLYNRPVPAPVNLPRRRGHGLTQGLALAGALLFGFGFRRRPTRWFTLTLLAIGTLASLAGISACGGSNSSVVTPGTYAYTISAMDVKTTASVTASFNVTVP
jgi:hypothetical protein